MRKISIREVETLKTTAALYTSCPGTGSGGYNPSPIHAPGTPFHLPV